MKKTNSFYFFFFLLGVVVMIGAISVIATEIPNYIFMILIALVVVVILIVVSIKLSNGTLEQRTRLFKECIKCNQEIDIQSDYCKHCGAKQENTITCDFCGGENHETDSVCKHCNALLK